MGLISVVSQSKQLDTKLKVTSERAAYMNLPALKYFIMYVPVNKKRKI